MKTYKNILLAIAFLTLLSGTTFGATWVSVKSGKFGDPATWGADSGSPTTGDDVFIQKEHGVYDAHGTIKNLSIQGSLEPRRGTPIPFIVEGTLRVYDEGAITINSSGAIIFKGDCINDGKIDAAAVFSGENNQNISGGGTWNGGGEFSSGGGLKIIETMTVNTRKWTVEDEVVVKLKWILTNSTIDKSADGSLGSLDNGDLGSGVIQFYGTGHIYSNESGGSFSANVRVESGSVAGESGSISSTLTVAAGAAFSSNAVSVFGLRGDVNINEGGTLTGRSINFSGANIRNQGTINPNVLTINRDGAQSISGSGEWKPLNGFVLGGSGVKSLSDGITIDTPATLTLNSSLDLNGNTLTMKRGNFTKNQTASVEGAGKIVFRGNYTLYSDESTGNLFKVPLEIIDGTRTVTASSGLSGAITVGEGAILNVYPYKNLNAKSDVTVKPGGSIAGSGTLTFKGKYFVNDGDVASWIVYFSEGDHFLSGAGKFSGNNCYLQSNSSTRLQSGHQFISLTLESKSLFDVSGQVLKIARALGVAADSTMLTENSTIEYNGSDMAQSVATRIDYYYLTINNSTSVSLSGAEKVKYNLKLERGVFNIGANRLTVCGQIIKVNGTLNGTPTGDPCLDASSNAAR